ncbi:MULTISPECIES: pyridoxal 5'-phosphate synthase [Dermacoccus]|uniref:Pyridoxamine 5'-phosphate oxidase n=2 Tax=Dermacoccus TaxID=57495 RepID=A0A417Z0R3_9MICO|nr:pyridoxal 5'-phosphate synthase [Dermacoccus abyssi]RHW43997.1 pyridoxamine 5'-phosphate oxidase [Dermacoccus abyssi]
MTANSSRQAPREFADPPHEPLQLVERWLDEARADGVRDPQHMALATADARGHASNRTVSLIAIRSAGLIFASHATSPKGRELAETGWASCVLYWREVARQVIVSGPVQVLPTSDSDELWANRPPMFQPMSVLSKQSAPLDDEDSLRSRARELANTSEDLPRPSTWIGYVLQPAAIEFWQSGDPDRLYQRLLYERVSTGWRPRRLQP